FASSPFRVFHSLRRPPIQNPAPRERPTDRLLTRAVRYRRASLPTQLCVFVPLWLPQPRTAGDEVVAVGASGGGFEGEGVVAAEQVEAGGVEGGEDLRLGVAALDVGLLEDA